MMHGRKIILAALAAVLGADGLAQAQTITTNPYLGITYIDRTETLPRAVHMHIVEIDLTAPGLSFELSPHAGVRDTTRQTTTGFISQVQAQVGINGNFFNPVNNSVPDVDLAGLAVSRGNVVSPFEGVNYSADFPVNQSYAIVPFGAALNIDPANHASIVHRDPSNNAHITENVSLWNAIEGSAQIITNGAKSIPVYQDANNPNGLLTSNATYSNSHSWYDLLNARTAIGYTQDGKTLVLFTVDKAVGSLGMSVGEVADVLKNDYGVYNALNLDGGGSTAMAMENPLTHTYSLVNASANNAANPTDARPEGSNLAVFALPVPEPASLALLTLGGVILISRRRTI